jgi:RNA polymerase sigma-70 factor (ECF subfamily)
MQIRIKEEELSRRFCSNADQKSFKAVYDFYWDYLFSVAFKKTKSADIAQDLVQDTFINLWNYRSKVKHVLDLRMYMTTMLKYQFLKGLKQEKVIFEPLDNSFEFYQEPYTEENFSQIEFEELYDQIQDVIASFPNKTREIFSLNRVENKSIKEIAADFGITESTVRTHLSKASSSLKHELKGSYLLAIYFWIFNS